MSAEAKAELTAGRSGFGALGRLRADFQQAFEGAGHEARAYGERICAKLDAIEQHLSDIDATDLRRIVVGSKIAVAAADVIEIDGPRAGYEWIIQGWTIIIPTPSAQAISLFVGSRTNAGLRAIINTGAATGFARDVQPLIWVPPGTKLFVSIPAGLAVGDTPIAAFDVAESRVRNDEPEPERV